MATPLTADRFLESLRAEGLKVVEVAGWRTHNRNSKGAWGPVHGVMIHHTVSQGTQSSVDLCYHGHSTLPGPLCHGVVAKDGTVYLVGNGRANHAGGGDPNVLAAVRDERYNDAPPDPHQHQGSAGAVDGNPHFYGFECINLGDGKDPWPAAQVTAIAKLSAALCRAHGWSAKSVIGHSEWSDWKSDPRGPGMPSMTSLRNEVQARLSGSPASGDEEVSMPLSDVDAQKVARAVWEYGISNRFRPLADGTPRVIPARYFQEWSDSHFDDLLQAILDKPVAVLTDAQLDTLASRVADILAERLAE